MGSRVEPMVHDEREREDSNSSDSSSQEEDSEGDTSQNTSIDSDNSPTDESPNQKYGMPFGRASDAEDDDVRMMEDDDEDGVEGESGVDERQMVDWKSIFPTSSEVRVQDIESLWRVAFGQYTRSCLSVSSVDELRGLLKTNELCRSGSPERHSGNWEDEDGDGDEEDEEDPVSTLSGRIRATMDVLEKGTMSDDEVGRNLLQIGGSLLEFLCCESSCREDGVGSESGAEGEGEGTDDAHSDTTEADPSSATQSDDQKRPGLLRSTSTPCLLRSFLLQQRPPGSPRPAPLPGNSGKRPALPYAGVGGPSRPRLPHRAQHPTSFARSRVFAGLWRPDHLDAEETEWDADDEEVDGDGDGDGEEDDAAPKFTKLREVRTIKELPNRICRGMRDESGSLRKRVLIYRFNCSTHGTYELNRGYLRWQERRLQERMEEKERDRLREQGQCHRDRREWMSVSRNVPVDRRSEGDIDAIEAEPEESNSDGEEGDTIVERGPVETDSEECEEDGSVWGTSHEVERHYFDFVDQDGPLQLSLQGHREAGRGRGGR